MENFELHITVETESSTITVVQRPKTMGELANLITSTMTGNIQWLFCDDTFVYHRLNLNYVERISVGGPGVVAYRRYHSGEELH